jgi:hypothetical protein
MVSKYVIYILVFDVSDMDDGRQFEVDSFVFYFILLPRLNPAS